MTEDRQTRRNRLFALYRSQPDTEEDAQATADTRLSPLPSALSAEDIARMQSSATNSLHAPRPARRGLWARLLNR